MYIHLLNIAGSKNKNISSYKELFRDCYKDISKERFEEKWKVTYFLLQELKNMAEPKYTKLLRASSDWMGESDYNVYEFNITPVEHNKEVVTMVMAISSIWGRDLEIKMRRAESTPAIEKAFKKLSEQYPGVYPRFSIDDNLLEYLYLKDSGDRVKMASDGNYNMGMDVEVVEVLIY